MYWRLRGPDMKIIFTIAWRNIWRHPARSGVLLMAVAVGLWAGVFAVGTTNGLMQQRIDYVIESELTHLQIHHPQFRAEGDSAKYIPDYEEIVSRLNEDKRVKSFTLRTITDGMLQSPVKTSGVRIRGIDVESETRTTVFHENIVEGEYLDTDIPNAVIMGKNLAEEHNMRPGNRIVLTFEDTDNELVSAAFNIAGFFDSGATEYDKRNVFVVSDELIDLLSDRPVYHEIAVMLHDQEYAAEVAADLNSAFAGIESLTWRQLSPELSTLVELGGFVLFIITLVIMTALAFGILNTMLMALFERLREIGMLLSIGMSRLRVFMMILLESVILTISGAFAGLFMAWISISYYNTRGINLEMFASGLAEVGWDHIIYPFLDPGQYFTIMLIVAGVTMLASIYPAVKAVRVNPLEAAKNI